jgi:hypothetical protein
MCPRAAYQNMVSDMRPAGVGLGTPDVNCTVTVDRCVHQSTIYVTILKCILTITHHTDNFM